MPQPLGANVTERVDQGQRFGREAKADLETPIRMM